MEFLLLASFGEVMGYIGYVLLAILILLIMITVHELGHYLVGKAFGFGIEEFAIGFGPKLFKKTWKSGEKFSIRLIPLGGFCSFRGEDADDTDPKAFNNKKPWQRILVLLAGAFMNYLTALLIIFISFGIYGQPTLNTYKLQQQVIGIEYTFEEKDTILSANGKNIYTVADIMNAIEGKEKGDILPFTVRRGNQNVDIEVKLLSDTKFRSLEDTIKLYDALGIYYELDFDGQMVMETAGLYSAYVRHGFWSTIGRGFEYSYKLGTTIFNTIGQLITGRIGLGSMGGTITTISMTAGAIKSGGFRYFLNIASLIGVNLAVFNLLPVPALDGSRVIFTVIEWIRGKPLNRKVEAIIHAVGFVVILLFAIFIDFQHCF